MACQSNNTYYVSTTGDDNNPGTQTQPWRTVAKAASTAQPGDTVIYLDGTYDVGSPTWNSGNTDPDGNPCYITHRAQNPGNVTFVVTTSTPVLDLSNVSYLAFIGLVIDKEYSTTGRSGQCIRLSGCDHIRVVDCNCTDTNLDAILLDGNCTYIWIQDSIIHPEYPGTTSEYRSGIHLRSGGNTNITIAGCEIYNTNYVGIWIEDGEVTVDGCNIHHTGDNGIHARDATGSWSISLTASNNKIHHTNSYGPRVGNVGFSGGNGIHIISASVGTVEIYRNFIYNVAGKGILTNNEAAGPISIENNTIYAFNEANDTVNNQAGIYTYDAGTGTPTVYIRNNIVYNDKYPGTNHYVIYITGSYFITNLTIDYNGYYATTSSGERLRLGGTVYASFADYQTAGNEPNSVVGQDPLFQDAINGDFYILNNSPMRNVGYTSRDIGASENSYGGLLVGSARTAEGRGNYPWTTTDLTGDTLQNMVLPRYFYEEENRGWGVLRFANVGDSMISEVMDTGNTLNKGITINIGTTRKDTRDALNLEHNRYGPSAARDTYVWVRGSNTSFSRLSSSEVVPWEAYTRGTNIIRSWRYIQVKIERVSV